MSLRSAAIGCPSPLRRPLLLLVAAVASLLLQLQARPESTSTGRDERDSEHDERDSEHVTDMLLRRPALRLLLPGPGRVRRCHSPAGATQPPFHVSKIASCTLQAIAHSHSARHIDQRHISNCFPRTISSAFLLCCCLPHLTHLTLLVPDQEWRRRRRRHDEDDVDDDEPHSERGRADDQDESLLLMPHTLRTLEVGLFASRMGWPLVDSVLSLLCHPPLHRCR